MIYLSISDTSVEVIQTVKSLIGGEKIVASGRKELPEGLVINGLIADKDKLFNELLRLFNEAYPKSIKDTQVSLVISNKQVFSERFIFEDVKEESRLVEKIFEETPNFYHINRMSWKIFIKC